jgi:hypothetical protein
MQPDNSSESRLASGVKAVALIVLLGLIAVVSGPVLHSPAVVDEVQRLAGPANDVTSASSDTGGGFVYFPDQYPAPTTVTEQPPTF